MDEGKINDAVEDVLEVFVRRDLNTYEGMLALEVIRNLRVTTLVMDILEKEKLIKGKK